MLTFPYLARVLGPSGWGAVVFAQAIGMVIASVVEYGFDISASRETSRQRNDPQRLSALISGVLGAKSLLAILCIAGALFSRRFTQHVAPSSALFWASTFLSRAFDRLSIRNFSIIKDHRVYTGCRIFRQPDSRLRCLCPSVLHRDARERQHYGLAGQTVDGKEKFVFQLATIAINRDGHWTEHNFEQVTLSYDQDSIRHRSRAPIVIDQQLSLAKDDEYLLLAVWDPSSGRLGTLQISLTDPATRRESPGATQRLISK